MLPIAEFAPLWEELFPTEQARIVRLLVARVDVAEDHIAVRLRAEGLQTLVEQLRATEERRRPHDGEARTGAAQLAVDGTTITGAEYRRGHPRRSQPKNMQLDDLAKPLSSAWEEQRRLLLRV